MMTLEEQLIESIRGDDVELTKSIIKQAADVNYQSPFYKNFHGIVNESVLDQSLLNHSTNHFEALIGAGAKIRLNNSSGRPVLDALLKNPLCTTDHLKLFVSRMNFTEDYMSNLMGGDNSLFVALKQKHITPEYIDLLIELGMPLNYMMSDGRIYMTALMAAAQNPNLDILKCVLKYDNNIEKTCTNGRSSALIFAVKSECIENIKWLISKGAKTAYAAEILYTNTVIVALHVAVLNEKKKSISVLLENGGNVNEQNELGQSSLMLACERSLPNIVEFLLKKGADITQTDNEGRTALHYISIKSKPHIIKLLIDHGADKDSQDNEGVTPLMLAIEKVKIKNISMLIACGASVDVTDNKGRNAMLHHFNDDGDVIKTLLDAGTYVDHQDQDGNTPIHNEVNKKNMDGIQLLLEAGADVNIKNKKGQTLNDIFLRKRNVTDEFKVIMDMINLRSLITDDEEELSLGL